VALAFGKEKHDATGLQHVENSREGIAIPGWVEHTITTRAHRIARTSQRNHSCHPQQDSRDRVLE
jgi:hypothetical protein